VGQPLTERLLVRVAGADDVPGIRAVAESYGTLGEWPERPDYLDFELEESALSVAVEGEEVVGFAGVLEHGGVAHLADLFVRNDRRGQGVGRVLLEAALPADGVRTVFASSDRRALPLYVRSGLRPVAPLLYLAGDRAAGRRLGAAREPRRCDPPALLEADAAAAGRERGPELAFLQHAGAYGLTLPGGYAVVRAAAGPGAGAGAWIGPAAGNGAALLAFVAAAATEHEAVKLALFGPHPALGALLDAGFRITAADTYMASRLDALDTLEYLPSPELG
jgi:GNAT superfamily N-acetyltransferase